MSHSLTHVKARGVRRRHSVHAWLVLPVAVVVVLGVVGWAYVRGDLNPILCDGPCPDRYVTPPQALVVAEAHEPTVGGPGSAPIDGDALASAVSGPLAAESLGRRPGLVALDARDGRVLVDRADRAFVPASTTKVLTALAVLDRLGPESRFTTRVLQDGDRLTLVGGGDPYLTARRSASSPVERADLATLARRAARQVRGPVRLRYDASLFSGPAVSPTWEPGYVPGGVVAPIHALWIDRGRVGAGRSADPARDAARAFADLLRAEGVRVIGEPEPATAAGEAVARVHSARLVRIVERFLAESDNEVAEVLLRQAAIGAGQEPSFAGGAATVETVLTDAGVPTDGLALHDGSGLSRRNRISARTLAHALVHAARTPRLGAVLGGLPVAGLTGTLDDRFAREASAGRGLVRAKTGTLTGVHTLAGIATLPQGRPVAFAVMANGTRRIDPLQTQAALDRVAAAIADCACRG